MLKKLSPDISSIRQGLDIIEERLTKYKLNRKDITKAMLDAEETMVSLLEHADGNGELQLSVRKLEIPKSSWPKHGPYHSGQIQTSTFIPDNECHVSGNYSRCYFKIVVA